MSICVARQPIFTGTLKVFGYELFFREQPKRKGEISADTATSATIINAFHDMGIDHTTNAKRAFVIFTEKLLLQEVATLLPPSQLVIEPAPDITPTDEVIAACQKLRVLGYSFAFDEYVLRPEYAELLPCADYVRFDFSVMSLDEVRRQLIRFDTKKVKLLAKKLETNSSYEMAKSAGFDYFQGRFFCKPVNVKSTAKISPSKLPSLQLINLSLNPDANYDMMADIIKCDVALSYMLFRVVNSAYFGLLYTVTSIKHALTILGIAEIHKWVTLISLARMCDNKPNELISLSLIRARFMELLAPYVNFDCKSDELFLIGLMSLMDALLDIPLKQVFQKTGISESVSAPLLTGEGERAQLLQLFICYEDGNWEAARVIADAFNLTMDTVSDCYKEALKWAQRVT